MLEIAWFILFISLFGVILRIYTSTMKKLGRSKKTRLKRLGLVSGITLLWLIYTYVITNNGVLSDTSLPPRMPIFLLVPLFLFTGIFLWVKRKSPVLHSIPRHIPIAYQSFRAIIEVLFYFTFLPGIFPIEVTFEGYNYDILLGLSAPFIAYYAYKKENSERLLILWNIAGILIVGIAAFIFITSFYFPSIWGASSSMITSDFLQFPFILLPAFFMPSAIFVHILSIVQLTKRIKVKN